MIARVRVDAESAARLNRPTQPLGQEERAALDGRVDAYRERLAAVGAGLSERPLHRARRPRQSGAKRGRP